MVGKAKSFSDEKKEAVYQAEIENETYSTAAQQNSYNLGSVHFSDQSGIGNFPQSGRDQRNAALKGALFRGNIGFDLQTCLLDVGTETIDLNNDSAGTVLDVISTDRFVTLSAGTTSDLTTITGAQRPGQRLRLYNTLTNTITIKHTDAATVNTIRTPTGDDIVFEGNAVIDLSFDITTSQWRVVSGPGGAGTGTFIASRMDQDQIANLAIGNHVQFNEIINDGGIVLQGQTPTFDQTSGIFELKAGKTYYLSAFLDMEFTNNTDIATLGWYDITNAAFISQLMTPQPTSAANQNTMNLTCETIFSPVTDVTVELRINTLVGGPIIAIYAPGSQSNIFEFSGISTGGGAPTVSPTTWKIPARAKTLVDVPNLAAFDVITDGVTLVEGDRVLLTEQTTQSENGLWEVGVVAGGLAPLTRPDDFDTDAEVLSETFVAIEEGTQTKNQLWHLITDNPITVDVSNQVWNQFAPGSSGGPDLGGGEDGIDGAGEFVNDGRIATGDHITKRWEQATAYTRPDNGANDIIWLPPVGNTRGRLLIVGDSNLAVGASYSEDIGDSWVNSAGLSGNYNYVRAAYDPAGDVVVTVSSNGVTTNIKERSTDRGANWINITSPNTDVHNDLIWSAADSIFLTTTNTATSGIQTSPTGVTWTVQTTPAPISTIAFWRFIAYSTLGGFYLASTGGNNDVMTSPDGVTWTAFTANTGWGIGMARLIYSEGQDKFVAVGRTSTTQINSWTSTDGITWEQFTVDTFSDGVTQLFNVVWSPSLSLYLAVGNTTATNFGGIQKIWVSNDAETWTRIRRPVENISVQSLQAVTSAEDYGQFVAISQTTTEQVYRTFR